MKKQKVSKEFFDWINNWGKLRTKRPDALKELDYETGYKHAIMDVLEKIK